MYYLVLFILCQPMALSSCGSANPNITIEEPENEQVEFEPSRQKLDELRQWFWENPPDSKNRAQRRDRMAVIQAACDKLTPADFRSYYSSWAQDDIAGNFEKKHPALYYLQKASANALDDIRKTKVEQGVAIWYIYNMGYVFKTAESCFGIDIKMRHSEQLADILDFLLITHEHQDHYSAKLIDAMIALQKPVITRWREGTTIINEASEFSFGDCRVKIDIGDHHYNEPDGQNDMLMFQVDCGKVGNKYTIYHSGDGSNYAKMTPDRKIDLFIVHVDVGMSVEDAIAHLKPRMTFVSHVMELSHSPNPPEAWRWSFDYAFERVKNIPDNRTAVLTWGERWLAPETILHKT
jgi:L-ascorbate metabolism protein UlaG (beta-lactamase superfamily)